MTQNITLTRRQLRSIASLGVFGDPKVAAALPGYGRVGVSVIDGVLTALGTDGYHAARVKFEVETTDQLHHIPIRLLNQAVSVFGVNKQLADEDVTLTFIVDDNGDTAFTVKNPEYANFVEGSYPALTGVLVSSLTTIFDRAAASGDFSSAPMNLNVQYLAHIAKLHQPAILDAPENWQFRNINTPSRGANSLMYAACGALEVAINPILDVKGRS